MTAPVITQSTIAAAPPYAAGYSDVTARPAGPSSGLTEDEARGFNTAFAMSFLGFLLIAAIAHFLVWQWRPWIPGAAGYPTRTTQVSPASKASPTAASPVSAGAVQVAATTPTTHR